MPLLRYIVHELDGELTRLQEIRRIVAGLSRTSAVVRRLTVGLSAVPAAEPVPVSPEEQAGRLLRRPRSDAGSRRGSRPKPVRSTETRALASVVPSGPVVFYPGRQQADSSTQPQQPDRTAEDLETASRALAARWATAVLQ